MFQHTFKLGNFDVTVSVDDEAGQAEVLINGTSLGSFPYASRDYSDFSVLELYATNNIVMRALPDGD